MQSYTISKLQHWDKKLFSLAIFPSYAVSRAWQIKEMKLIIRMHAVEVDLIFSIHWALNISQFSSRIVQSLAKLISGELVNFFSVVVWEFSQIHPLKEMYICVAINAYCLPNMHKKIYLSLYRLLLGPLSRVFFPNLSVLSFLLITWVLNQISSSQKGLDWIPYQKDLKLYFVPLAIFSC